MGRDKVVRATPDLYGMRPKGAVMLAAQVFAQILGLEAIRAPGTDAHISRRMFAFLRLKKRIIHADYGQFWEELGGSTLGEGDYVVPTVPQVRDLAAVKPNKRAEWKKRHALNEQLVREMHAVLAAMAGGSVAPVPAGRARLSSGGVSAF